MISAYASDEVRWIETIAFGLVTMAFCIGLFKFARPILLAPWLIVTKLNETLSKALDDPAKRQRLLDLGSVLPEGKDRSPEALLQLVKTKVVRWTPILKGGQTQ